MTERTITFGTDGIRGVAGLYPLDPATVLQIGRALATWVSRFPNPQCIIGRDTRISGAMIGHALIAGILAEGVPVVDVGVMSTPGLAYLAKERGATLGIVISASHNPYEQNGIKLFGSDGFKLDDDAEEAIEQLISTIDIHRDAPISGSLEATDATADQAYIDSLVSAFPIGAMAGLRVVLDCANGAASLLGPTAFRAAGAEVIPFKAAPNGTNINVNCGSEFVRRDRAPLLSAIQGHKADLGIAFDGDADRVVFVTPDGTLIDGDHLMGILALRMKETGALVGSTVVATDMSNSGLEHYLSMNELRLIRTKVGDRYVMEKLREGGFVLGGEQAGHVILLDGQRTCGDGIYVGMLIGALAAENKRSGGPDIASVARAIPRYPQVIANAHLTSKVDLAKVEGLQVARDSALAAFGGVGRVNIRFSGTEPNLLRAMVEGGPDASLQVVVERAIAMCSLVAAAAGDVSPIIDVVDCMTGAPVQLDKA